jgi:hypothetical protein
MPTTDPKTGKAGAAQGPIEEEVNVIDPKTGKKKTAQ